MPGAASYDRATAENLHVGIEAYGIGCQKRHLRSMVWRRVDVRVVSRGVGNLGAAFAIPEKCGREARGDAEVPGVSLEGRNATLAVQGYWTHALQDLEILAVRIRVRRYTL